MFFYYDVLFVYLWYYPSIITQEGSMSDTKKIVLKEIYLWKKRFSDSSKILNSVYKDLSQEAKKVIQEVRKWGYFFID